MTARFYSRCFSHTSHINLRRSWYLSNAYYDYLAEISSLDQHSVISLVDPYKSLVSLFWERRMLVFFLPIHSRLYSLSLESSIRIIIPESVIRSFRRNLSKIHPRTILIYKHRNCTSVLNQYFLIRRRLLSSWFYLLEPFSVILL